MKQQIIKNNPCHHAPFTRLPKGKCHKRHVNGAWWYCHQMHFNQHTNNTNTSTTQYSLYQANRLSAETDSEGNITAHYIYLNGKPIAKIQMQKNTKLSHKLWKSITSLGGLLEGNAEETASEKII